MESKRRKTAPPELLDELIFEILLRLPAKSLLRLKSVSKAWRATISDSAFIRAHLQRSASEWQHRPSWLVAPHELDHRLQEEEQVWPTTFSSRVRFYQWDHQAAPSEARLLHGQDFPAGEFSSVHESAHCDGLVLLPTDKKLYLFNPATRAAVALPESGRNEVDGAFQPVGLGLDPRTGRYKAVQAFYRSRRDPLTGVRAMGMEVFTVGRAMASWRETAADPPCPAAEWLTAKTAKGALYWVIDELHPDHDRILRFSLEDETFALTAQLPIDSLRGEAFHLDVMHGELCVTAFGGGGQEGQRPVGIWTLVEDGGRWEQRYSLDVTGMVHPMALLPGRAMMVRWKRGLYRYQLQTPALTKMCELDRLRYQRHSPGTSSEPADRDIFFFDVVPYMESLVPIQNVKIKVDEASPMTLARPSA